MVAATARNGTPALRAPHRTALERMILRPNGARRPWYSGRNIVRRRRGVGPGCDRKNGAARGGTTMPSNVPVKISMFGGVFPGVKRHLMDRKALPGKGPASGMKNGLGRAGTNKVYPENP
jgi:hypothetical protein